MKKRLNDLFPLNFTVDISGDITTDGIFSIMAGVFSNDWIFDSLEITASDLDMQYHENHSGQKLTTNLVRRMADGEPLDAKSRTALAKIAYRSNYERWKKLVDTIIAEYNPVENYNMEEQMSNDTLTKEYHKMTKTSYQNLRDSMNGSEYHEITDGTKEHEYVNVKDAETGSETHTRSKGTVTVTKSAETTTESVQGFNSTTFQPSTKSEVTGTGENGARIETTKQDSQHPETDSLSFNGRETTKSGKETDTQTVAGHDTLTYQGRYNERTGMVVVGESSDNGVPDKEVRNYTLTRKGNIGVTTTQQMLEQERNIAMWDFIQTVVFPDVDKLLCLKVY